MNRKRMNHKIDTKELLKSIRNRQTYLENEGNYWSDDERKKLDDLYNDGVGISEIALELERTEQAVFVQINLNRGNRGDTVRKCSSAKHHKCLCTECEIGIDNCTYRANNTNKEVSKSCSKSMQM